MDPLTIAAAATSVIGQGLSFLGGLKQAKAAEYTADYNATVARQQAGYESKVAEQNALRARDYGRRVMGSQRAALASSGLAPTGTPLLNLGDTASSIQQEIFDIGREAALRSRALISSANMASFEGKQTSSALRTSSIVDLAGGLAGTAFKTADSLGFLAPRPKQP